MKSAIPFLVCIEWRITQVNANEHPIYWLQLTIYDAYGNTDTTHTTSGNTYVFVILLLMLILNRFVSLLYAKESACRRPFWWKNSFLNQQAFKKNYKTHWNIHYLVNQGEYFLCNTKNGSNNSSTIVNLFGIDRVTFEQRANQSTKKSLYKHTLCAYDRIVKSRQRERHPHIPNHSDRKLSQFLWLHGFKVSSIYTSN